MAKDVPIWEKSNLTLEEAAAYSGIGTGKLRELTNEKGCNFVLWVGNKRLIKKRLFDSYIEPVSYTHLHRGVQALNKVDIPESIRQFTGFCQLQVFHGVVIGKEAFDIIVKARFR